MRQCAERWLKAAGAAASQDRITAPLSAGPRRRSSRATALTAEPALHGRRRCNCIGPVIVHTNSLACIAGPPILCFRDSERHTQCWTSSC